jgi:hypothetical protein
MLKPACPFYSEPGVPYCSADLEAAERALPGGQRLDDLDLVRPGRTKERARYTLPVNPESYSWLTL